MKIAVISSAQSEVSEPLKTLVATILTHLRFLPHVEILTGGSLGVPGLLVTRANQLGIRTVAYSPDKDEADHCKRYDNLPLEHFSEVRHFSGFTLRSQAMVHDADGVLLLNGRMGTLSEFTIALEEGKRVGIITGTGGVADHLNSILEIAQKEFPGQTFFSDNPIEVLRWLTSR